MEDPFPGSSWPERIRHGAIHGKRTVRPAAVQDRTFVGLLFAQTSADFPNGRWAHASQPAQAGFVCRAAVSTAGDRPSNAWFRVDAIVPRTRVDRRSLES